MAKTEDIFTARKPLAEICSVPERIISVYSLEQHVWADGNSDKAKQAREPEYDTIREFQIDPVRPFLNDMFKNLSAPYNPSKRDLSIGQGYWIQAEFGSGKSHLLCFLSALALGNKKAWEIVKEKEERSGRGKRESLFRFWEDGLAAKNEGKKKGVFVVGRTLVGAGAGTVGQGDKGRRLTEYILDAVKEQLQIETGKNLSLYPSEMLADRFIRDDLDRYRTDLKKFLKDPKFFSEDEFEDINDFVREIQDNKTPEYKRSCGNKLWRFYTEYLKVQPYVPEEPELVLKHLVETILHEGYEGILLVLDEMSLFMMNRDEKTRWDDAQTLVVLANRLAKVHNLPIWTVCSAQQAIEVRMGQRNLIADDRLKLVKLLEEDKGYYEIVLARVRLIKNAEAIKNYYLHYKRGFTWPNVIGEQEFSHFFPFHKPGLEVLRAISYKLTTTRSAIAVMHQVLKYQMKNEGDDLIRLWELFDEAVRYEEDPSGTYASLSAIRTQFESDYRSYESCKRQLESLTKGILKAHQEKSLRIVQTLFLYHIAQTRQLGLGSEDIANSVLIERDAQSNPEENIEHYETISENLKKELRQIVQTFDENNKARFKFDPVFSGVDPRDEFRKARDEAERNEVMQKEAWEHLLGFGEWIVKTRKMSFDLSNGVRSIFVDIAPQVAGIPSTARKGDQPIQIVWAGKEIEGMVGMRDFNYLVSNDMRLTPIESDETDRDFAIYVGTKPAEEKIILKVLAIANDPRIVVWTPASLSQEERSRLLDFAAYRKMIAEWQGKESEDANTIINWVSNTLQTDLGKIYKMVTESYSRGRIDTRDISQMDFHVAGEMKAIIAPLVERVLDATYESRDVRFDPPIIFGKEEGIKVINGLIKTGSIPKGAKPDKNISAAQNFGYGLMIMKRGTDKQLDVTANRFVDELWKFIDSHLRDDRDEMKIETLYKNFVGIGGPKDYGLGKRILQVYLLSLVKLGKMKVGISAKSGLAQPAIEYSNISEIEFNTKVLDALTYVQKMAKPEHWEVLRPYAEKILDVQLPQSDVDSIISEQRGKLIAHFNKEKDESQRLLNRANVLFDALQLKNPYEDGLKAMVRLFSVDLSSGNDIDHVLNALKNAFSYKAFDEEKVSPLEVDDLASRVKNYANLKVFVSFETELKTLKAYCDLNLAGKDELKPAREIQKKLIERLKKVQYYIDSDVRLKTELIGQIPATQSERDTLGALIREYSLVYSILHEEAIASAEKGKQGIASLVGSAEFQSFVKLETISALQSPTSEIIVKQIGELQAKIFACQTPRSQVEQTLYGSPMHDCGLSFDTGSDSIKNNGLILNQAVQLYNSSINNKMQVFLNTGVRDRLKQATAEPLIKGLLECATLESVRRYLIEKCASDESIIDIINKYLKQVLVKKVKISGFSPTKHSIEQSEIDEVVEEFRKYLESEFRDLEGGGDTLPIIDLE